jgi:hypothetical protein
MYSVLVVWWLLRELSAQSTDEACFSNTTVNTSQKYGVTSQTIVV